MYLNYGWMILSFCTCRYHEQNQNVTSGDFRFGPVFMRLCFELGLVDLAAETLTDEVNRAKCSVFNMR